MSVDVVDDRHRMWFSWRPKHGIGYAESTDGLHWHVRDTVVLGPNPDDPSEELEVTRPFVLVDGGELTMWYAAHGKDRVAIARATSVDGETWQRQGVVLSPTLPWEKAALMCPSVLRDSQGTYHMWYSGGERYEPDAIGYATSTDGISWTRVKDEPVLRPGAHGSWEADRVAGAQVLRDGQWLYAIYIGFANGFEDSSIGIARSSDGISWERHEDNPVITRGAAGDFDSINVYKPFVVVDAPTWRMWFNGSSPISGDDASHDNRVEQIGYASCQFHFRAAQGTTSSEHWPPHDQGP
jgi:predicted GH43/DUF377 family glycosyl hydrolase